MIINFKNRYIRKNELLFYPALKYFHFYNNYEYLYTRRLVYYQLGQKEYYLRINKDLIPKINQVNNIQYICILSDKMIDNYNLIFYAQLNKNNIFCINLAKYIKNKFQEHLVDYILYSIYNFRKFEDINFYNKLIIKSEELQEVKEIFLTIINSRNIINIL